MRCRASDFTLVIVAASWLIYGAQPSAAGISIPAAKMLPDNNLVGLSARVVTYAGPDLFYVEEDSRSGGIRVVKTGHTLAVGMRADVTGLIKTNTCLERYILADSAAQTAAPNDHGTVLPIAMTSSALGGTDWRVVGTGGQRGVTGGVGLNNVGLLVKVWGRCRRVDATTFTLDEGSERAVRCVVSSGASLPSEWEYVTVTGASSTCQLGAATYPPCVLVRDIRVLAPNSTYTGEMVYVPDGSFPMGGNDHDTSPNYPQHSVYVPGYSISRHEITRGQYRQFMLAGGYTTSLYWSSAGWNWKASAGRTQPDYWTPTQDWFDGCLMDCGYVFTQTDSHPVVGVTYHEAEAFCKWAGGHLPTEAQWEKAACWTGSHPNVYPWGDTYDRQKLNCEDDTRFPRYRTTPVGSYPTGASPYGCLDMAGNVWEWCGNWFVSYPGAAYPFDETGSLRVIRGGGWPDPGIYSKCANREYCDPNITWDYFGFRLAR